MMSVANRCLKLFPKVVHKPVAINILDEHVKTQPGQCFVVLGVEVLLSICMVSLKELHGFCANDNSRVLGNLALKFVSTGNGCTIEFAGMKFYSPSYVNGAANWIAGCEPKET